MANKKSHPEQANFVTEKLMEGAGHVAHKISVARQIRGHLNEAHSDIKRHAKLKQDGIDVRKAMKAHKKASKAKMTKPERIAHVVRGIRLQMRNKKLGVRRAKLDGSHQHRVEELERHAEAGHKKAKAALLHPDIVNSPSAAEHEAKPKKPRKPRKKAATINKEVPPQPDTAKPSPTPKHLLNVRAQYHWKYPDPKTPIEPKHKINP